MHISLSQKNRITYVISLVLYHSHTRPPTLCKTRSRSPLPTLIILFYITSYLYSFSDKNCIQPEDGHSSNGRNMQLMLMNYIHLIIQLCYGCYILIELSPQIMHFPRRYSVPKNFVICSFHSKQCAVCPKLNEIFKKNAQKIRFIRPSQIVSCVRYIT